MARVEPENRRPSLIDRLVLRLSTSRRIDGLWIGGLFEEESVLDRVEEALRVIKVYDRLRYNRLIRDLERVWVTVLPGPIGSFDYSLSACRLDRRFVLAETSSPALIASVIVHEATHARLWRCGIGYEEELRPRVEAVCRRRELAFAANVPDSEPLREQAARALTVFPHDYWTNAAFRDRNDQGAIEALRYLGTPDFLIRAAFVCRALVWGVIRFARRLARFFGI